MQSYSVYLYTYTLYRVGQTIVTIIYQIKKLRFEGSNYKGKYLFKLQLHDHKVLHMEMVINTIRQELEIWLAVDLIYLPIPN